MVIETIPFFTSDKKRFKEGTLLPVGPNQIRLSFNNSKNFFLFIAQLLPLGGITLRPEGVMIS